MKVSVVVPALNEAERIEKCLASVAAQAGEHEVIVVDGGSTDGTTEVADPHAIIIRAPPGRGSQMNAGARAARGEVLLFLHADSELHADALQHLRQALTNPVVAGGTFTLRFDADRFLLRVFAYFTQFRPRLFHYGDQGIFVRRSVFERMNGFADLPIMEDVDFLRRLRTSERCILLNCPVTTSARRYLTRGVVRQQVLNAGLVILFNFGVSPRRLAQWYRAKDH